MSALSDLRVHPRTGAVAWREMDIEIRVVAELDNYPGLYGFQLKDKPRQDTIAVYEGDSNGTVFAIVTTDPLVGQVYIDYRLGFCLFNIADNGKTIAIDYEGGGSNANIENMQTLVSVPLSSQIDDLVELSSLDDLDQYIINDVSVSQTKKIKQSTVKNKVITDLLGSSAKTTLADADAVLIRDSADSNNPKLITYENLLNILCPIGVVLPYSGRIAPSHFLMLGANTTASRSIFANLFNILNPSLGTCTISIANPGVVSLTGHGFITGDRLYFTTTGGLPTGLTANTAYFAVYIDANSFYVATSYANAIANTRIQTTGSQSGIHTCHASPWGIGNGSTTFDLPDPKAAAMMGAGTSTIFTQNNTLNLGRFRDDQLQGHWHNEIRATGGGAQVRLQQVSDGSGSVTDDLAIKNLNREPVTDGTNGTPRIGTETHPKSIGMNFIIKY